MRWLIILLIAILAVSPVLAETVEAKSYLHEFDITFWQTFPFAMFWGYLADRQLSNYLLGKNEMHGEFIVSFAVVVSGLNAYFNTKRVTIENERARDSN